MTTCQSGNVSLVNSLDLQDIVALQIHISVESFPFSSLPFFFFLSPPGLQNMYILFLNFRYRSIDMHNDYIAKTVSWYSVISQMLTLRIVFDQSEGALLLEMDI